MASNSNIDIEDATQHLRDILKLDRPENNAETSSTENQTKTAFNGELNGLFGSGLLGAAGREPASEAGAGKAENMSCQDPQIICLSGDDSSTRVTISSSVVEIVASHNSSINSKACGSNKVKIKPVAKYDWEHKYYYGSLIAVCNSYLAYAIRGANNCAMIRVLSQCTAERTLLKGFTGAVADLAFAHLDSSQLACLDEAGNMFIWQLSCSAGKIQDEILVHIRRPADTPLSSNRRLIWCPFIPEENEEGPEESCQTLALLHEDRAEVWDLDILRSTQQSWPVDASDLKEGFIVVRGHSGRISEGVLSPDGTVLATASHDGFLKFWQIYIEGQDQPRCLHEWKPHEGRPLSCLLFCDNHKKQDPEVPFWRFLITGADQNRELKMWCTVSWTCLQTIRFSPDPFNSTVLPSLKVALDLSAGYLVLSDVQRKVLYVMEVQQNQEKGRAGFTAVSEFLLTHPVLSFGLQDVSCCRLQPSEVLPPDEDSESMTTEGSQGGLAESKTGVQIHLYSIHTKCLQDVQIWFQPHLTLSTSLFLPPSESQEDFGCCELLADTNAEGPTSDKESGRPSQGDLRRVPSLPIPADFLPPAEGAKPTLMTPDAFMTPTASIPASPGSSVSSLTVITAMSSSSTGGRMGEELTQSSKVSLESSALALDSASGSGSSSASGSAHSSPRSSTILIPGLGDQMNSSSIQVAAPLNPPLSLDLQAIEPLLVPQASPTRERSPDVISSASTAMSLDIPEIASETLPRVGVPPLAPEVRSPALHSESMASATSALHLLSPRNRSSSEHGRPSLDLGGGVAGGGGATADGERLSATPSLLEAALSQEGAAACPLEPSVSWPAAPDITRETRDSLADCSRDEMKDKHKTSPFHRHSYSLPLNDSQDASAEQSDHDDEVVSLASSSGNCASRTSHRLPVKDWKVSPRSSPKLKKKCRKDDGESLQSRQPDQLMGLDTQEEVLELLRSQQRELSELRQSQLELMQRLTTSMDTIQSSVMAIVEQAMINQQEQSQRRMERMMADGREQNRQLQEHLSQQVTQNLSTALCGRMDKLLREEMKKSIPQAISKSLDPVTGQMNSTIAAKLTAVEGALKENVTKVVKSKNTTDAIGKAAAEAMQGPIQAAYKEAFQGIVLPVFEKGCQSMFQQINDSFKQGTHEYIQQLESHLKNKKQRELEARDPLIGQLQQMVDTLQNSTDQLAATVTASVRSEVQHQLHIMVGNLQDSILTQVQRIVKGEVSLAMKEQQAAVTSSIMQAMRSAAGTPVPPALLDYQAQQQNVLQLLQQGQFNQAFQQALSAADLNLVLYVCETIDSQQVFSQHPCPLIQPVLLSLIQQLSTNLTTRSELKISYLEDAVMNLDHSDPVTRDHMSSVLTQVRQKLFQFLQLDPHSPLSKRARRLMMMLQGLVTQ
ncbi:enhancer of mRNA-decapping protein 4-like isoform X1 [Brienomyrus brachyistius]|uniref:enhancer of mRNA-decapping protein 4-like isoform X1 n=2 Tax=Brienomyrus brachyistius TaxID=42636 RepID=UPI0020B3494A|nr:enhancer of mRNA-decapping protein 4-like isoform X1 [Brienomyrus brachyistius]